MKAKYKFFQVTVKHHKIDVKCRELSDLGHEIVAILPFIRKGDFWEGEDVNIAFDYIIVSKIKANIE